MLVCVSGEFVGRVIFIENFFCDRVGISFIFSFGISIIVLVVRIKVVVNISVLVLRFMCSSFL